MVLERLIAGQQERLRALKDLDAAALQLQEACAVIPGPACADADVRATIVILSPYGSDHLNL